MVGRLLHKLPLCQLTPVDDQVSVMALVYSEMAIVSAVFRLCSRPSACKNSLQQQHRLKKTTWRLSIRRPLLPIKTLVVVHFDVPVPVAGCPLASTQPFHNQSCVGQFFSFDRTPISCKSFWFSFYQFILIRYRVSGRKETLRRILIGSKTCV